MLLILTAALILICGHGLLFLTIVKFFGIKTYSTKLTLGIILGFLSISFIIANTLIYSIDGWLSNAFYTFSGAWLGLLLYASMAMIVLWIIYGIGQLSKNSPPMFVIAAICFGLAILYTGYGIWNAQHPRLNRFSVTIPNLPSAWKNKTIVQLSDIHVGPVNRQKFLAQVVDLTNSVHPDLVLITGDLFDGPDKHMKDLAQPLQNLKPTRGTFFITGNHETYAGVDASLAALQGLPLTVLRDKVETIEGLSIIGVDFPALNEKKDLTNDLLLIADHKPNIVLFHEPKGIDEFKEAGANLLLAGHTHVGQLWPFGYITRSIFHGYDYGLHVDGSFTEYTSSGVGTWGPAIRTGNRPEIDVITLN